MPVEIQKANSTYSVPLGFAEINRTALGMMRSVREG